MNIVLTDFGSTTDLEIVSSRRDAVVVQEEASEKTTASVRPPELFDVPSNIVIDGKVFGVLMRSFKFVRNPFENPRILSNCIMSGRRSRGANHP